MTYIRKNVDKSSTPGSGAATPKDPNVAIFKRKDILTWPVRDGAGVKALGNFVMKPGAKPIYVYMTGVNQDPGYETDGEVDMEQVMQKFVATHPGDTLDAHEFFQNHLGEDLIVVYGSCSDDSKRIYGTQCSPLRLKNKFSSNKDGNKHEFTFEQIQATRFVPAFYDGVIPYADPTATDVTVDLTEANGNQYKVEALDVTDGITVASIDLEAGEKVTLIGSGGADPATLSKGAQGQVTVLLKDGLDWTALENATITLSVFVEDAATYLIEESRS